MMKFFHSSGFVVDIHIKPQTLPNPKPWNCS